MWIESTCGPCTSNSTPAAEKLLHHEDTENTKVTKKELPVQNAANPIAKQFDVKVQQQTKP